MNNTSITQNTIDLQEILNTVENLPEAGSGGGVAVQSDYTQNDSTQPDYIKNRPFYTSEGYKYEWDGKVADESKRVNGDDAQYFYYKISDEIMSVSDLVGAKATNASNKKTTTIAQNYIKTYDNGSFAYNYSKAYEVIFVCVEAGSFDTVLGTVELTPGLWFAHPGFYFGLLEKAAEIKQLDNEYIAKATAIDEDNSDLPVTAGLLKTELENKADLVDGKIPVEQLPEGIGSGTSDGFSSVQSDYAQNDSTQPDYIKNRPFYTGGGYKYEWDGVATDETKKVYGSKYDTYYFYKIADVIMTVSDFVDADVVMKSGSPMIITESGIKTYANDSFAYRWGNYELIFMCVEAGSFETILGTTELTPGLWFLEGGFNVKVFAKEGEVKQLDNEYIAKATAIDDANADLPVTAGLLKTELENKADLVDGKIPVEQLPEGIGSGSASGGTGENGVSPTINVTDIEGGYEIIITDIDGEKDPIYVMDGIDGKSAYQIAYDHNFAIGTEAEWIASLKGDDGKSAYEIAYELDSTIGTKEDWIESLKGSDGDDGTSVTIISTTESENDSGENIVTFSDGSTITIKNGSTGAPFTYDQFKPEELEALKPKKDVDYFDGEDYVLTSADKTEIANEAIELLDDTIGEITEIASGKCKAEAFDTVEDMTTWLSDINNTANLKLGDVFYIRAVDVPDYWWEPIKERAELSQYTDNDVVISGIGAARVLETTKVKLEDYALIANVPTIKVNNAANADTIGGKQIVVSNEAPDPNGEDNQNIITIVI